MIIGMSGYIGSGKDTLARFIQAAVYASSRDLAPTEEDLTKIASVNHSDFYWKDIQVFSGWQVKKFADPLKEIVCILIGCKRSDLENQDFKKRDLGPEWARSIKDARNWLEMKFEKDLHHLSDEEIYKWAVSAEFKWTRTVREMLQEIGTDLFRERFSANTWVNATMAEYRVKHHNGTGKPGEEKLLGTWPNWIISDMRFMDELYRVKDCSGILIRINRGARISDHPSEISLDKYQQWDFVVDNTGDLIQLYEQAKLIVTKFNLLDYE